MSSTKSNYYVYALTNPLKEDQYFYIGYSNRNRRIYEHMKCYNSDTNQYKKNTIKKILRASLKPTSYKILENVTKQEAVNEEIRLIAFHGRADKGLGSLTNMTDGGDGGTTNIPEDLTGQKFGRLTAIYPNGRSQNDKSLWLCECVCGNEKTIIGESLKIGATKSCGCLSKESVGNRARTHGKSHKQEYKAWATMKGRCYNPNTKQYDNYGAREIIVCERWLESFENYYNDRGEAPSDKHIFSRMDRNGNFEPSNCKWMTRTESNNNLKSSVKLLIENESKSIKEWSLISGTKYKTISSRLVYGWSDEQAVFGK